MLVSIAKVKLWGRRGLYCVQGSLWKVRPLSCPLWFLAKVPSIVWDLCLFALSTVCLLSVNICISALGRNLVLWNKIDLLPQIREKVELGCQYERSVSTPTRIIEWMGDSHLVLSWLIEAAPLPSQSSPLPGDLFQDQHRGLRPYGEKRKINLQHRLF